MTAEYVAPLLQPPADAQDPEHATTYGPCKQPFGIVRIRAVEFLTEAYKVFWKDLHQTVAETELYDSLLFFFDHYPFHNILHQKVCDIFSLAIEKNHDVVINHLLYNTSLIRKILETSRENGVFVFASSQTISRGLMIFVRKLANKLVDLKAKNEEVNSFLESIPEWAEFEQGSLTRANNIENKPLATDPRVKKNAHEREDDYFDLVYKLKDASRSGFKNKKQEKEQDEDEVEVEVEETNEEGEQQDMLAQTISQKKSRNSGPKKAV